jgi:hypothetical protein
VIFILVLDGIVFFGANKMTYYNGATRVELDGVACIKDDGMT